MHKKEIKWLKEVEDDPIYSEEQRQLYRASGENLNTEKQGKTRNTFTA